jgi:hypothetical protein
MSAVGGYCCKSRKSNDAENLAKADFQTPLPLQRAVAPMRRSEVVFVRNNEVPHIATYETHQRSWKISFVTQKRLLQQYRREAFVGRFVYLRFCIVRPQYASLIELRE